MQKMKNRVWLILLIMVVAYGTVKSQTVSNVSITGNLASGSEVTAAFIVSGPAPESIHYRWCEGTTLADTTHIGSDSN